MPISADIMWKWILDFKSDASLNASFMLIIR